MIPRRLSSDVALKTFGTELERAGASAASMEYLRVAEVYGVFDSGELVAGFALASPPLRVLELLPHAAHAALGGDARNLDHLTEISSVWCRRTKTSLLVRTMLWIVIVATCALRRADYVAFCRREGLARIYDLCEPTVLWSVSPDERAEFGRLYKIDRTGLLIGMLRYVPSRILARWRKVAPLPVPRERASVA